MYKMESYCLNCRKYTENVDPNVLSTSNNNNDNNNNNDIIKMCDMW